MMDAKLRRLLLDQARAVGVDATDLSDPLERYLQLLLTWNAKINLTAIRDPADIITKHFVDSLAAVPHVPATAKTLVDVGSGPGFPGAIIALARHDLQVTLVESNQKKCAFLQTLRRELPLPNAEVDARRAEDVRGPFDVAISRATLDLPAWLQLGQTLVTPTGTVLGMEGAETELPPGATRHSYPLADASRAIVQFHVER